MFQELKFQFSTAILTLLTLAAVVAALLNFQQLRRFHLPEDGVIWVDRNGAVEALSVPAGSPGAKAGLHRGDQLKLIDGVPIQKAADATRVLANIGVWKKAVYHVSENGVEFDANVLVAEVPFDHALLYEYAVGAAYLLIGLFVYFRRGTAHKALHFYILCLASFVFFCFHYTGQLNGFDKVIYFGN
jgi:two-component system, NtrC family, sensor kinase